MPTKLIIRAFPNTIKTLFPQIFCAVGKFFYREAKIVKAKISDSELAVAFCTGESKDVSSNFVVKIPQSMFDLLSLENGASPNERRSLQLARDQMEVERKAKEPICEGYTIKPDSCHGKLLPKNSKDFNFKIN